MMQLINFISEINEQNKCNKELLKKIEYQNKTYDDKYNIDLIFANPYYINLENKQKDKKGIYVLSKLIDLEINLLKVIQQIPNNDYIYYIDFLGYSNKIDYKIIPDFKTLIDKKVFIIM